MYQSGERKTEQSSKKQAAKNRKVQVGEETAPRMKQAAQLQAIADDFVDAKQVVQRRRVTVFYKGGAVVGHDTENLTLEQLQNLLKNPNLTPQNRGDLQAAIFNGEYLGGQVEEEAMEVVQDVPPSKSAQQPLPDAPQSKEAPKQHVSPFAMPQPMAPPPAKIFSPQGNMAPPPPQQMPSFQPMGPPQFLPPPPRQQQQPSTPEFLAPAPKMPSFQPMGPPQFLPPLPRQQQQSSTPEFLAPAPKMPSFQPMGPPQFLPPPAKVSSRQGNMGPPSMEMMPPPRRFGQSSKMSSQSSAFSSPVVRQPPAEREQIMTLYRGLHSVEQGEQIIQSMSAGGVQANPDCGKPSKQAMVGQVGMDDVMPNAPKSTPFKQSDVTEYTGTLSVAQSASKGNGVLMIKISSKYLIQGDGGPMNGWIALKSAPLISAELME